MSGRLHHLRMKMRYSIYMIECLPTQDIPCTLNTVKEKSSSLVLFLTRQASMCLCVCEREIIQSFELYDLQYEGCRFAGTKSWFVQDRASPVR